MAAAGSDRGSLDNLHDIVVPLPEPWWPPAPGWYVLGALLILVAAWLLIDRIRHWWTNRYRGTAMQELHRLQTSSIQDGDRAGTMIALDQLLKRVALAAWPRRDVAGLSGEPWIRFLSQTGRVDTFTADQTSLLRDVVYSTRISRQLSAQQCSELFEAAGRWIQQHRREEDDPQTDKGRER